ncbi:hypothetical protein GGX14DRAFT_619235 [Mycena pura]|uniref:Uncharacterized protein n=1 Tax=Mycena pura TaxID=153505 RepID=A0AAD6YHD2_9AGAR|nr:hypothetical protein GGX14DRAFT_619235 [Mycena pura]
MASEPSLPPELEREIFEISAVRHPRMAPVLVRVARRVLVWSVVLRSMTMLIPMSSDVRIEPFLYRAILVNNSRRASTFLKAIKIKGPAFADAVRHLRFDPHASAILLVDDAANVLKLCKGVTNFATLGRFTNPTLLPVLATMHIQRLVVRLSDLFGGRHAIDLAHPLFMTITHLDILEPLLDSDVALDICPALPALPALTHLCLGTMTSSTTLWTTLDMLLADCARLQLLAVLWPKHTASSDVMLASTPLRDVRLVMGLDRNISVDWAAGATGLPNFWTEAESFVARKRSGEISGMIFKLYSTLRKALTWA